MRVMDPFSEAVTFAQSHEMGWTRDPMADPALGRPSRRPAACNRIRGPVHARGGVSGVIRLRAEDARRLG